MSSGTRCRIGPPAESTGGGGTPGVVLVGDRSHDVLGAARFGIPTVLVTWGYGAPDEHRTARWTACTPDELGELLDGLTAGSTAA